MAPRLVRPKSSGSGVPVIGFRGSRQQAGLGEAPPDLNAASKPELGVNELGSLGVKQTKQANLWELGVNELGSLGGGINAN